MNTREPNTKIAAGFYPGQEMAYHPVTGQQLFPDVSFEHVQFTGPVPVQHDGYVYIWLSNESENTKVWFDDLRVTHTQTIVTQATDYGVWGDVLREMKSDEITYRYGYQGQYSERDEETGWQHFEAREYDPIIGRWSSVDPIINDWSPYTAMNNSPIYYVDKDGRCPECPDENWANWNELQVGYIYVFATDGPHAGAEYMLLDKSLGVDGWVRVDNGMLNEVTITPSITQKVNDFGAGVLSSFVDFTTTLWTSMGNGFSHGYYGSIYHPDYDDWRPYSLNNEWRFERVMADPHSSERQKEIMLNTVNILLTTVNAGIKIPVSNNTIVNGAANFVLKTPAKAGVMKGIEKSLNQVH